MASAPRVNYVSLQYLRALAALLVVLAHATEFPYGAGAAVPFWTGRTSYLGVEIFFVVSGFIITEVSGPGRFDPVQFAARRFVRVAPLYWLVTAALFLVVCLAPQVFKTTTATGPEFLKSLLFIPYAQAGAQANHWSPLLKPGWTLNVEVFFYAVTAALFWCRRGRTVWLTVVLGTLALASLFDLSHRGVIDFYARKDLLAFLGGAWLAVAHRRFGDRVGPWIPAAAGLGAGALVAGLFAAPDEHGAGVLAIPAALLIVATALLVELRGRLPEMPRLAAVGDASYSLYLTHLFTVGLAWAALKTIADPLALPTHVAGTALIVTAAVLVSRACYRLVERPLLRWSRAAFPDRRGVTAGSGSPGTTAVRGPAIPA